MQQLFYFAILMRVDEHISIVVFKFNNQPVEKMNNKL